MDGQFYIPDLLDRSCMCLCLGLFSSGTPVSKSQRLPYLDICSTKAGHCSV